MKSTDDDEERPTKFGATQAAHDRKESQRHGLRISDMEKRVVLLEAVLRSFVRHCAELMDEFTELLHK